VIRVLLVDDQELVRGGFAMILDAHEDIAVVGEADDGAAAVDEALRLHPDVVLMDVRMPGLDGIEATRRLAAAGSRCRVLMVTTFDLDEYVYEAIRAGASGFMLKDVSPRQLVEAVRTVAKGDALLAPAITRRLLERFIRRPPPGWSGVPAGLDQLTPREIEVLRLVARGLSNAEIARELIVAEATIKTHVERILAKLEVRDRTQAVVVAYETGLVEPGSA
jgi:DNA-binding NarL/FixJ family response regulator